MQSDSNHHNYLNELDVSVQKHIILTYNASRIVIWPMPLCDMSYQLPVLIIFILAIVQSLMWGAGLYFLIAFGCKLLRIVSTKGRNLISN